MQAPGSYAVSTATPIALVNPVATAVTTSPVPGSVNMISRTMNPLAYGPIVFSPPRFVTVEGQQIASTALSRTVAGNDLTGIASGVPRAMELKTTAPFQSMTDANMKSVAGAEQRTDVMFTSNKQMPRDWVTYQLEDKKAPVKFRPRGFSVSSSQRGSKSTDWDIRDRYLIALRSGPTECPDHILAKSRLFPEKAFTSPYVLYYFDETAPNKFLLKNDVTGNSSGGFLGCGGSKSTSKGIDEEALASGETSTSGSYTSSMTTSSSTSAQKAREVVGSRNGSHNTSKNTLTASGTGPVAASVAVRSAPMVSSAPMASQPMVSQPMVSQPMSVVPGAHQSVLVVPSAAAVIPGPQVSAPYMGQSYVPAASAQVSATGYPAYAQPEYAVPRGSVAAVSVTSSSSSMYSAADKQVKPAAPAKTSKIACCGRTKGTSVSSSMYMEPSGANRGTSSMTSSMTSSRSVAKYMTMGYETYVAAAPVPTPGMQSQAMTFGVPPVYPYGPNGSVAVHAAPSAAPVAIPPPSASAVSHTSVSRSRNDAHSHTSVSRSVATESVIEEVVVAERRSRGCCGNKKSGISGTQDQRSAIVKERGRSYSTTSGTSRSSALVSGTSSETSKTSTSVTSVTSSYTSSATSSNLVGGSHSRGVSDGHGHSQESGRSSLGVGRNPYVGLVAEEGSESYSQSESMMPTVEPCTLPDRKRNLEYGVRKMFFDVDDMRVPNHGTGLKMLPQYSISYKNYPVICYDVVAPQKYNEFFRVRKAPGMFA